MIHPRDKTEVPAVENTAGEHVFVPKCHWCGQYMRHTDANYCFEPLNEFGPEQSYWEHRDSCPPHAHAVTPQDDKTE